jgi:hypothetical protein
LGKEKYSFSNEMKLKAQKKAQFFNPDKPKEVHHIFPKSLAKKYNIPRNLIVQEKNAIALEKNTFHAFIHGKRLTKKQLIELFGDDLTDLDLSFTDEEVEWKGFTEDDYIFLAIAYLGIAEEYFDKQK